MKKITLPLTLFYVLVSLLVSAQTPVPTVPEQLSFADISVRLDPDARRIIQQDVNALLSNRQYWTAKLDRVVLYFPMIESIFIDEDVPTDFKYLAVQESSLTPDAVSSSSAVGYWQFKRETAMDYGMRVDDQIDERKNITSSSRGAAKYLKKSNAQFNNWVASLYSYYLGAGGIAKLIPPDWSYAREIALDGRTDRYILRFFAHKVAIENALQTHQTSNRFALIEYPNGGGKSIKTIAEELDVDEFELRKYNRWVIGETLPTDKAYIMAVPVASNQINDVRQKIVNVGSKKTPEFVQNDVGFPVLRRVTTGLSSKNDPVLYEINGLPGIQAQAGDNAALLSRKAKISLSSFLRYNDMGEKDPIIVNDVYYLAKKRKKALVPFHTVRDGETSRSISQRYGIRLKKLMRYNRLDRIQKLLTGRVMWLRDRRPANKPVEVINAPAPPVYDQTPTPANREVASVNPSAGATRTVNGGNNVPKNASERKLYQPKLVGGGVTPSDGTSEPASAPPRTEPQRPSIQPTSSPASTNRPAPTTSSPTDADGSQRVVIVRTPDATQPVKEVPVATTPERDKTADVITNTTSKPKTSDATASTQRTKPTNVSDADMGRPETGKYEGPREQQADGSLTAVSKTPSRSTNADVAKNDTRPVTPERSTPERTTPERTAPETKPVTSAPSTPAVTRPTTTPTTASSGKSATGTHTVEAGQTYYSISKLYGLSVDQLMAMNNLTNNDVLEVGQQLLVKASPTRTSQASAPANTATSTDKSSVTYHTVAKGETMFRLTQIYGVTAEQIQSWNNMADNNVKLGQKIKIVK
ncbi:LysM peptidoglycan-binding domain-containing protein [Spirosoma sp. BT702]|uniref:LysM peptidoglycan-binding domain-containing protein n=1 Tax=Spirosoma profusum TaxID=2771354 RepID=A0A926XYE5_9BACT|nr:LysM peptidoglycan-binding domain-containing protein [Spirosoma profusum]MBD2703057.1 LysM peptidoglycan-binding domain-containing protein [Spirosoma profusum]